MTIDETIAACTPLQACKAIRDVQGGSWTLDMGTQSIEPRQTISPREDKPKRRRRLRMNI